MLLESARWPDSTRDRGLHGRRRGHRVPKDRTCRDGAGRCDRDDRSRRPQRRQRRDVAPGRRHTSRCLRHRRGPLRRSLGSQHASIVVARVAASNSSTPNTPPPPWTAATTCTNSGCPRRHKQDALTIAMCCPFSSSTARGEGTRSSGRRDADDRAWVNRHDPSHRPTGECQLTVSGRRTIHKTTPSVSRIKSQTTHQQPNPNVRPHQQQVVDLHDQALRTSSLPAPVAPPAPGSTIRDRSSEHFRMVTDSTDRPDSALRASVRRGGAVPAVGRMTL